MRFSDSLLRIAHTHKNLSSTTGATIVELMVVLTILSLGISALLETLRGGILYALDTENNIKAINIAREGIEAMTNIRDTNWLRFSSDKANCWKVKDYNANCIGDTTGSEAISSGSYTIVSRNGVWYLSGVISGTPYTSWDTYKSEYSVGLDSDGFYTQTGVSATTCSSWTQKNCKTIFSREIYITIPGAGTQTGVVIVQSIARWNQQRPRSVILETTLTNWKSKF